MADRIATDAEVAGWRRVAQKPGEPMILRRGDMRALLARLAAAERVVEAGRQRDRLYAKLSIKARDVSVMMAADRAYEEALAAYDAARKEAGDA